MVICPTEVWLYGSSARGDHDGLSDVDLLVVGDDEIDPRAFPLPGNASISRYSWAEVEHMASYGSLFLHHIRLEGRPLLETNDRRLRSMLSSLPPYKRVRQELESFELVVSDVARSLKGDHSPAFELAVLGTAARHAAILGCYLLGDPKFSRRGAFRKLLPELGYSRADLVEFEHLYDYRVWENRGEPPPRPPSSHEVGTWVRKVRALILKVKEMANEHVS